MRIYIKTAPYKQNSYLQHLIEHIVIGGYWNLEQYFKTAYGVLGTSWLDYSTYFLPPTVKVETVLDQFVSPLDMSIMKREIKMIKEELSGQISDTTLLVNRIGKEIYWKKFWRAQFGTQISKKILQLEHQKYYTKENIRIADDDFLILKRPDHISEQVHFWILQIPWSRSYKVRWDQYFTKIFKDSASAYTLCYLLDWIMAVWGEYSYNYLGKWYESPVFCEFFEYSSHLLLIIDEKTKKFLENNLIDSLFFSLAVEKFLETPCLLQEIALTIEVRSWKQVNLLDLKKYLTSLSIESIKKSLIF